MEGDEIISTGVVDGVEFNITLNQMQRIIALYKDGMSYVQIAKELGIHQWVVKTTLKHYELGLVTL